MPGSSFPLPKVTIITPAYNSAKFIKTCLESVAVQTYANKEHLIIDGLSKDNTAKIVEEYQLKYPHIKLISERDKGIYDAMNKGIDLASGEWLFFMGSDDELAGPDVLSSVFEKPENMDYDILYGNIQHKNAGRQFDNEFTSALLARFNIAHQCIFYRKTLFSIIGKFNLSYAACADYFANIKWFGNEKVKRRYIKTIICIYNEYGFSSIIYDKNFYRDKLKILLKYVKFEKPEYFTNAGRHTIYEQLKHRDIPGAFKNLVILFRHQDKNFDKVTFIKEFIVLLLKTKKNAAGVLA
jgi:glycosyltransferase involved in cell wall biosynthesis